MSNVIEDIYYNMDNIAYSSINKKVESYFIISMEFISNEETMGYYEVFEIEEEIKNNEKFK
jgi:hypothetical protein